MRYWVTILGFILTIENIMNRICQPQILGIFGSSRKDFYWYNVCQNTTTTKELWNELEAEYGIDDSGIESFTASNFNKFAIVDGKNPSMNKFISFRISFGI